MNLSIGSIGTLPCKEIGPGSSCVVVVVLHCVSSKFFCLLSQSMMGTQPCILSLWAMGWPGSHVTLGSPLGSADWYGGGGAPGGGGAAASRAFLLSPRRHLLLPRQRHFSAGLMTTHPAVAHLHHFGKAAHTRRSFSQNAKMQKCFHLHITLTVSPPGPMTLQQQQPVSLQLLYLYLDKAGNDNPPKSKSFELGDQLTPSSRTHPLCFSNAMFYKCTLHTTICFGSFHRHKY